MDRQEKIIVVSAEFIHPKGYESCDQVKIIIYNQYSSYYDISNPQQFMHCSCGIKVPCPGPQSIRKEIIEVTDCVGIMRMIDRKINGVTYINGFAVPPHNLNVDAKKFSFGELILMIHQCNQSISLKYTKEISVYKMVRHIDELRERIDQISKRLDQ